MIGHARVIVDRVKCPDCGHDADALFGDHGGTCLIKFPPWTVTAREIVRRWARGHEYLSINEVRPEMDRHGIEGTARGPAFTAAVRAGWIRPVGHVASTDAATKRHAVQTYQSLLYPHEKREIA